MDNELYPISPAQYAAILGVTKATACNWCRAWSEGKSDLPEHVQKIARVGRAWLLYVPASFLPEKVT